jgi:hypothetical protein
MANVLGWFALLVPYVAYAEMTEYSCNIDSITVVAEDSRNAELACDTIVSTDLRLRDLGLEIDQTVRVEITPVLDVAQGVCVGLYSTAEKKLQLLPLDCMEEQPGRSKAFPAMEPELLFQSVIVHEMVHAYLDQQSSGRFLPRVAHEYLAYAIQLDALSDAERDRVLEKADMQEASVELEDINEAILNLMPVRFAAMAWLHFNQEGGDASLVRRIIEGEQLFNSVWE